MTTHSADVHAEAAALNAKVIALLPAQYHTCMDAISPVSMGSAGLKYDAESRVAWNQIWTSFCDLALAGGPPHRGTLLEAPTAAEAEAEPAGYHFVIEELLRGIALTTRLPVARGAVPGRVCVTCTDSIMAEWLLRAIMAENVFVRSVGPVLELPAGPNFRLAKEIKNVIVALAKTCHYWVSHLTETDQAGMAAYLTEMANTPLLEPASREEILEQPEAIRELTVATEKAIRRIGGLRPVSSQTPGWVAIDLGDQETAAWYTRSAIAENILARRQEEILYLPIASKHPPEEAGGLTDRVARIHRVAQISRGRVEEASKG